MTDPRLHDELVRLIRAVSDAQEIAHTFASIEPLQPGVPVEIQSMELVKQAYDNFDAASAALKAFREQNPGL